jgi:predicted ATPase/Tfp pilus assembly protein PilF
VLCTSRQPLGLADELSWPLAGLRGTDAVRLFVERAASVRPGFVLSASNSDAITQICQALDGLPLAIELAAARTRVLTPNELADKLGDHLRVLTSERTLGPPRQQTLRATLDWSYQLLTSTEQALLRRLGVFSGGWSLDAAEAIGGDAVDVLDVLGALVARSLVVADVRGERTRYRLLETVRQYARERLDASGEADTIRDQHLDWFARLAEEAEPHLRATDQAVWLDRLEDELDNFRAALTWDLEAPAVSRLTVGLRLAAALRWYWFTRSRPTEARAWLTRAIDRAGGVEPAVRGRALDTAAALAHSQGAYSESRQLEEAALAVWRDVGDQRRQAAALSTLGIIAKAQGEHARAAELLEAAISQAREVGDAPIEATALNNLAALANDVGEYERARDYLQQSLAIKRAMGDAAGIATSLFNLGDAAVHRGELESALALLSEALALFRVLSAGVRIAQTLHSLGSVALRRGDLASADDQFAEARALFAAAGDGWGQALCIEGQAEVASARGRYAAAVRLFAAADAWRNAFGAPVPPNDRPAYDRALKDARASLGETAYAVAWAEGQAQALEVRA